MEVGSSVFTEAMAAGHRADYRMAADSQKCPQTTAMEPGVSPSFFQRCALSGRGLGSGGE